jgi:hypothetical protein
MTPKLLKVFFGLMGDKQRAKVDDLVKTLFGQDHNRSSERQSHPAVSFVRGHTQLTRLSADERPRQIFVLCALLQTESGRSVLGPRFDIDFDKRRARAKEKMTGVQVDPNDEIDDHCEANSDEGCAASADLSNGDDEADSDEGSADSDGLLDDDDNSSSCPGLNETGNDHMSVEMKSHLDSLDLWHMHEGTHPWLDSCHKKRFQQREQRASQARSQQWRRMHHHRQHLLLERQH